MMWAILPVKPLHDTNEYVLQQNLALLCSVPTMTGVLVVSTDPKVLSVAHQYPVRTLQGGRRQSLDKTLGRAAYTLATEGAKALMIFSDQPKILDGYMLQSLVPIVRAFMGVTLLADPITEDTDIIAIHPAQYLEITFGAGSLYQNYYAAQEAGLDVKTLCPTYT